MAGITTPYRPEAMETVRASHRQRVSAALYLDDGTAVALSNVSGSVTFSEDWSPHVQMKLSAFATTDPAVLSRIDPRKPAGRVDVFAGYLYPGSDPDVALLATGRIQERDVTTPGDVLVFDANSDELRAQESRWVPATQTKTFAGVLEALQFLQSYAMPGTAFESTIGAGYRADLVAGVVLEQGADIWSVMDSIALSAGVRIFVSPAGKWTVAPKTAVAGETAAYLEAGSTAFVSRIRDVLSRNGWYTAAVLKYQWSDGTGQHTITGVYTPDPGAGLAGNGQKVFFETRTGPISQYDADLAARATVANLTTRGDSYDVDAAACYWLRPGHTVQVKLADGTTARHLVRSVTFNLGAGTMQVVTREPSNL